MDEENKKNNCEKNEEVNEECKWCYVVENIDFLSKTDRKSILQILFNEYKHLVQEGGEGSHTNINTVDNKTITILYNIIQSKMKDIDFEF